MTKNIKRWSYFFSTLAPLKFEHVLMEQGDCRLLSISYEMLK